MRPNYEQLFIRGERRWWQSELEALIARWRDPEFRADVAPGRDATDYAAELERLIAEGKAR